MRKIVKFIFKTHVQRTHNKLRHFYLKGVGIYVPQILNTPLDVDTICSPLPNQSVTLQRLIEEITVCHIGATTVGTGGDRSPTTMYWSPNFLAV